MAWPRRIGRPPPGRPAQIGGGSSAVPGVGPDHRHMITRFSLDTALKSATGMVTVMDSIKRRTTTHRIIMKPLTRHQSWVLQPLCSLHQRKGIDVMAGCVGTQSQRD